MICPTFESERNQELSRSHTSGRIHDIIHDSFVRIYGSLCGSHEGPKLSAILAESITETDMELCSLPQQIQSGLCDCDTGTVDFLITTASADDAEFVLAACTDIRALVQKGMPPEALRPISDVISWKPNQESRLTYGSQVALFARQHLSSITAATGLGGVIVGFLKDTVVVFKVTIVLVILGFFLKMLIDRLQTEIAESLSAPIVARQRGTTIDIARRRRLSHCLHAVLGLVFASPGDESRLSLAVPLLVANVQARFGSLERTQQL
ncbi:hypothetical protein K525DRAFT_245034 [Schizophyllum commune Loenen D]|nr:hypothetical protein K525DRAFT_245034 [Schizophyllum commune Loenen D]